MRIWDLPVTVLCDKHLLGEHRELHAIWVYLTTSKGGSYRKHPETLRWAGNEGMLFARHLEQVREMIKRGFKHNTPLELNFFNIITLLGERFNLPKKINTIKEQKENLKSKKCKCKI